MGLFALVSEGNCLYMFIHGDAGVGEVAVKERLHMKVQAINMVMGLKKVEMMCPRPMQRPDEEGDEVDE